MEKDEIVTITENKRSNTIDVNDAMLQLIPAFLGIVRNQTEIIANNNAEYYRQKKEVALKSIEAQVKIDFENIKEQRKLTEQYVEARRMIMEVYVKAESAELRDDCLRALNVISNNFVSDSKVYDKTSLLEKFMNFIKR